MKKIKFLILALLGIIIIPTATNAYEFSSVPKNSKFWTSNDFVLYQNSCLKPSNSRGWILRNNQYYPDVIKNQSSCPDGYILGNYYADERDGVSHSPIMKISNYRYIFVSKNGEGLDFWRTSMMNNTQTLHKISIPSTTAYQYTTVGGQKFMLSQVYLYHNQFLFYDPTTRFSVSFLGKMKIENGVLLVNPDTTTDNIRFINFQKKKARSMTTTKTGALKWLLGVDISKDRLEALQFDKSYTMEEGGNRFLPAQFSQNSQGETVGWLYNEDTEFISPDFKGSSNTQNGAEAHRECINYYTRMHNLARFSDKCSGNGYDEQAMENFLAVKNWNGEGEKPQLTGSSAWICGIFADKKKEYKELYKEQWTDFEKEFNEFMFSPDALIPANKCKFLEVRDDDSLIKKIADGYRDAVLAVSKKVFNPKIRDAVFKVIDVMSFGLISPEVMQDKSDMIADSIFNLGFGYEEIHGEKGEVVTVSEIYADREELYELERKMNDPNLTPEERLSYQTKYNEKKQKVMKKYENFSGTGIVASTLGSGFKQGDFKVKSSNLFKKYYEGVLDSFNRGKSVVNFTNSCSGGFFSEINIFVYFFMVLIGFYIFNLLK